MPKNPVVYEAPDSASGGALFDMLTKQNQATFQHGLDMEKQEKANDFSKTLEILRSGNQAQREQEAFQRTNTEELMRGKAIGEYTGQQAVSAAGQGNVFPGLVEKHADEDVERTTGHPLFTPRPIDPRAATAAHSDFEKFLAGRQGTEEAINLARGKVDVNSIGQPEVNSAKAIAAELRAEGQGVMASAFEGLAPGTLSRKEYTDLVIKGNQELQRAKTRREVSQTFAAARVEAARLSAEARKYAADMAARGRIGGAEMNQLKTYQSSLNQQMTKLQNAEALARRSAENASGLDERNYHLNEADRHNAQLQDVIATHAKVTEAIGKANNQPIVDEQKRTRALMERQGVIQKLAEEGKISRRKTWAELSERDKKIVEEAHRALHVNE